MYIWKIVIKNCVYCVSQDDVYYTAPQQPQYVTYTHQRPLRLKEKEEQQDFSKIPGVPGVDYPVYHSVPHTNFDCRSVPAVPGMYANVETGCQVKIFFWIFYPT
mgnify:CR=1 FL=1